MKRACACTALACALNAADESTVHLGGPVSEKAAPPSCNAPGRTRLSLAHGCLQTGLVITHSMQLDDDEETCQGGSDDGGGGTVDSGARASGSIGCLQ